MRSQEKLLSLSDWGACSEVNPELFFPGPGAPGVKEAKKVCNSCLTRAGCLEWALENPDEADVGIWGAMTRQERKRETVRRSQLRRS